MKHFRQTLLAAAACALPAIAQAAITVVPGRADPWLAGMPDGSSASGANPTAPPEDFAPADSPVLFGGLSAGSWVSFVVTIDPGLGPVARGPGLEVPTPDGGSSFASHYAGAENGIANVSGVPVSSLVGVFLNDSQPSLSGAPSALNFSTIGTSFATLSPGLKQVFFIGDGLTGTGTGIGQKFLVPAGATRLYLGTMDGRQWYNNTGAYDVTMSVPEPETYAMMMAGLGLLGVIVRRRKRS